MPFFPNSIAGRLSLLLGAALVFANVVALVALFLERSQSNTLAAVEREVERAVSLVPAIESAPLDRRDAIALSSSTRLSQLSVNSTPFVEEPPADTRSVSLTRELQASLPEREVRASIRLRNTVDPEADPNETVAVSVKLATPDGAEAQWLNVVARTIPRFRSRVPESVFFLILGLSLVCVLGVALFFVGRLTRPLHDLADAARAAGRGDRTRRVAEDGPSELREAATAFNDMQARIGQFEAERMRTLAAVGHDLRTPITSLRIRAEMLEDDEAEPMVRILDEMTVMADGLVAFARGERDVENKQEIDLHDLLAEVCAEHGAVYEAGEKAVIQGRPVALRRGISNLVINALRYGGGANVRLELDGEMALVNVSDDGPGIPEDKIAEVFEPFVRGENSRSSDTGGSGLGLAIARNIAVSHGGYVSLKNKKGGGLSATFAVPRAGIEEPA